MPEPASKGARGVINPPQEVAPPATSQPQPQLENVFATPQATPGQPQTLGTRTLSSGRKVFNGEPIDLELKDADIKDVLSTFAEITGLNIAIDPGVAGSVNVDFVAVPWDQALDIILRQNNLTYVIEGNVMRIGRVERIAQETAATRKLEEEERLNVPLTTLSFPISYARAADVSALLKELASPRARILVDQRTNQLIISEIPQYLQTMQNLIATVDVPTRQVTIEARIVESSRTFAQQWGFNWGFGGDLDPNQVFSRIRARMNGIRGCYESGLRSAPTLAGRVTVNFTIGESGRVTRADVSGLPAAPGVTSCVAGVVRGIAFPMPTGGSVDFSFPIVLSPTGGETTPL
jgi:type IV pilus assembly protein PilQ